MEDFNLPSLERVALLERLQEAMGDAPPYFWAACHVCDLEALGKLVEVARIKPALVCNTAGQCRSMSRYWSAHPGELPKKPMPVPSDIGSSPASTGPLTKKQKISDSPASNLARSPLLHRNKTVRDLAEQRDKFCCVLTGDVATELAHIYPFHSIRYKEEDIFGARHMFWNLLKSFWPEEKVTTWQAELFPGGISEFGLERVSNLITISAIAHKSWNRGAFALKPISVSDDNTILKVQFFWQKKQQDTQATMSLLLTPHSTEQLCQNEGAYDHGSFVLHNCHTSELIKSGDYFELQTDDPDARPLPSFKLLEMQWFLQRVAGMAGAAGLDELDWEERSDEEEESQDLRLDDVSDSLDTWIKNSRDGVSNPGLDEGDISLTSINLSQPASAQFLRTDNLHLTGGSKHRTEDAEGDAVGEEVGEGDGNGAREVM